MCHSADCLANTFENETGASGITSNQREMRRKLSPLNLVSATGARAGSEAPSEETQPGWGVGGGGVGWSGAYPSIPVVEHITKVRANVLQAMADVLSKYNFVNLYLKTKNKLG